MPSSIGIVGTGESGGAIAFNLLIRSVCHDLILNDISETRAKSQAADLADAQFLTHTKVKTGTLSEVGQCNIAIIAAGKRQKPDQPRLDLASENIEVIKNVLDGMAPLRKDIVLVLVTNPVDILTYYATRESGLPAEQVIGTGTYLDTVRLKFALEEDLHIPFASLNTFVYGEHGESQFIDWGNATTSTGIPLTVTLSSAHQERVLRATKQKGYDIINNGKPDTGTAYGIAAVTTAICESILRDRHDVQPVSVVQPDLGCAISLPAAIGRAGAKTQGAGHFKEREQALLKQSVDALKKVLAENGLSP